MPSAPAREEGVGAKVTRGADWRQQSRFTALYIYSRNVCQEFCGSAQQGACWRSQAACRGAFAASANPLLRSVFLVRASRQIKVVRCRPSFKSFSRRALGCACTRWVRRGAQCKHRELAAERCVILQGSIATNGAQAGGGIRQPGGKTDTCPAADAGQDRNVLLATMLIGRHVSNDAGRRLELVEFLARLGIDGLEVAFERSVEHHAAGGRQGARPDRELFRQRPDDLAGLAVPGN